MSDRAGAELDLLLLEEEYHKAKDKMEAKRTPKTVAAYKEAAHAFATARTAFKIDYRDPEALEGTVIQPPSVQATASADLDRE